MMLTPHVLPDLFAKSASTAGIVLRPELPARFGRLEVAGSTQLVERLGAQLGVAIVGARAASRSALDWANALARALAEAGEIVVSGGALGIDGAAHEGALAVSAPTVAVLGTGIDVTYPLRHGPLFARIVDGGGALVSQFPRGTKPMSRHFPMRNPLIAALARAVVVVEASGRSGSLGTGQAALKSRTPLYCLPGSPGCDELLTRGARPALSVDALVATLLGRAAPVEDALPLEHTRVLTALARAPLSIEELAASTGTSLDDLLCTVLELESYRRLIRLPDGRCLALTGPADTKE